MAETSRSGSDSIDEDQYVNDREKYDDLCLKNYQTNLVTVDGKPGYDCVACKNKEGEEVDFADLEKEGKKDSTGKSKSRSRSRSRSRSGDEGDGKKQKTAKSPPPGKAPAAPEAPLADEPAGEDQRSHSSTLEDLKKEMLAEYGEYFAECMDFFDDDLYSIIDDKTKEVIKNIKVKAFERIQKSITKAGEKTNKIFNRKETTKEYQEIIGKTMQDLNEAFKVFNESTSEGGTRRSYRKKKRKTKRKKSYWFF